jgi:pimeloyl-ACP methyl ester carboxylesterase
MQSDRLTGSQRAQQPRPDAAIDAASNAAMDAATAAAATPVVAREPDLAQVRREIVVGDHRLETCRFGDAAQPLRVVLLHEGLGSVAAWRDFPARLAQQIGEPVLAYSRVGYGQSSLPSAPRDPGFMHQEAQLVLPALLRALAIERPILVGHSDGASIALIYAGTCLPAPAAVQPLGVAVMAPHLFVEPVTVDEIAKVSAAFDASGLASRLRRYHRDPVATFRSWADVWLSVPFRQWRIEAETAAVGCPLLAIQGRDDQYGTAQQIERLAELAPHAKTLMLADCRHSPHQEQPAAVLAALTGFIAGLPH